MNPRISVIMGIYNCAPTLALALDSLLAQTYQDFKVIMCDDGSTDNTADVAQKYVDDYPGKFILIKNEKNLTLAAALNRCLDYADTEYVARMDGDDISLPERFEKEVTFLDAHHEYAIVSGSIIYFDENGEFRRGTAGGEVTKDHFIKGTPFCHAASMVRKDAYDKVEGYSTDSSYQRVEDYNLWVKMYEAGFKGWNISEPIYAMRDDNNAYLRRTWGNRINEFNVRRIGFKMLNIPWHKRIWMFRPLAIGLLPKPVYRYLHRRSR